MRRLILMAVVAVLSVGCAVFRTPSDVAQRVELGMSVEEFKKVVRSVPAATLELDSMSSEGTVYRIDEWAGEEKHRHIVRTRLYFFDTRRRLTWVATRDFSQPFSHTR
ncbi:MAG: hypothetical protein LBV18_04245 [Alistipes sp.]|jgi:hypothetical protein|nr:hypothetical protein [Alistipes sp.]